MKRIRPCNDDANSTQLSEQNEHLNTDVQRKYRDDAHSLKLSYWDFPSTPLYTIFTLNIFRSGQCPCGRLRGVKGLHKSWCSIRSFHKFSQQNMTALKNQEIFSVVGEENNFFDSSSNRNLSASISQDSTQELCSYYKQLAADILKVLDKDDEIPLTTSPTRLASLSIAVEKEQRAYIEDVLGTADEDLWHQYFVAEWSSSCRPRENAFEVLPMQWVQRSGELEVTNQIPLGDPMEKFAFKFSGVQSGFYITAMCQLDICPMVSKGHQPEFSHNKMPCLLLWYAEHPVTFATHSCPSPRTRNERQHGDGVTQTEVQVHPSQNLLQYVIVFFRTETRQAADVHDSQLITCGTIRSYHTFIRGIECCLPLPGRLTSSSNGSKSLEDTIVLLVGKCANGRRFLFPIHGLSGNLAAQTVTGTLPLPPTVGLVTGMAILNYDVADDTGTVAWAFLLVLTVPNMGLLMIRVEGVSDPLTGSAVILIMLLRCCTLPHGEHPLDGRQLVVLRQAQKVWATAFGTDFLAEFSLACDSSQALGNTHYLSIACCRTGRSYSIRIVPLVIISAKSTALFATVSAKADLCVFLYDDKITQNWQSNKSGVAMMLCQWVLYDALLNENHNWAVLESVVDSGTLDALKGHINARKEHRTQRNRHHSHVSDNELLFNVLGEVSSICRAERCIDTLYLGTVKGYLIQVDFTPNLMQVLDKWGKWNDLLLNVKGTGTKQSKQFPTLLKIDSPLKGSYHTKGVRVRILGRATSAPIEHIQALSAHCDVSKKEIPCQLIVCTDVSGRLSVCRTIM